MNITFVFLFWGCLWFCFPFSACLCGTKPLAPRLNFIECVSLFKIFIQAVSINSSRAKLLVWRVIHSNLFLCLLRKLFPIYKDNTCPSQHININIVLCGIRSWLISTSPHLTLLKVHMSNVITLVYLSAFTYSCMKPSSVAWFLQKHIHSLS